MLGRSQYLLLEKLEVLAASCCCRDSSCPENVLLGGTGVGEVSEGFSTSIWSVSTWHSLCAWCWMLRVPLSSP